MKIISNFKEFNDKYLGKKVEIKANEDFIKKVIERAY